MKAQFIALIALCTLFTTTLFAQLPQWVDGAGVCYGNGVPTGTPLAGECHIYHDLTTPGNYYRWNGAQWVKDSVGISHTLRLSVDTLTSTVSGIDATAVFEGWDIDTLNDVTNTTSVGGDLQGNVLTPIVTGLQTTPITNDVPIEGQTLVLVNGKWTPTTVLNPTVCDQIQALPSAGVASAGTAFVGATSVVPSNYVGYDFDIPNQYYPVANSTEFYLHAFEYKGLGMAYFYPPATTQPTTPMAFTNVAAINGFIDSVLVVEGFAPGSIVVIANPDSTVTVWYDPSIIVSDWYFWAGTSTPDEYTNKTYPQIATTHLPPPGACALYTLPTICDMAAELPTQPFDVTAKVLMVGAGIQSGVYQGWQISDPDPQDGWQGAAFVPGDTYEYTVLINGISGVYVSGAVHATYQSLLDALNSEIIAIGFTYHLTAVGDTAVIIDGTTATALPDNIGLVIYNANTGIFLMKEYFQDITDIVGTGSSGCFLSAIEFLQYTASAPITLNGTNIEHDLSGVAAGTYGNANNVPSFTVDQYGHITAASQTTLSPSWSLTGNTGTTPTTNFLGTIDKQPIVFRTFNIDRGRVTQDGYFGMGTTSPLTIGHFASLSTLSVRGLTSSQHTTDALPARLNLAKSRGTDIAPTVVAANDLLGQLHFIGHDGTTYQTGAKIEAYTPAAYTPTSTPAILDFFTTPIGSNLNTRRMRIEHDGSVIIGSATTSNVDLAVGGAVSLGITTITATGALPVGATKFILNNAAAAIIITMPDPSLYTGRFVSFTRNAISTGTVTLSASVGQIQALSGTLGATTTIGAHSATGGGVDIDFFSDGVNWYR